MKRGPEELEVEGRCGGAGEKTEEKDYHQGQGRIPPRPIQHHRNLIFHSIFDRLEHP